MLVHRRALAASREKAQAMIQAGQIYVDGQKMDKPGSLVAEEADIQVHGGGLSYVSRGGLKLKKAIEAFSLDFTDKVVMDVGASTGGFTDCALQHGASRVYAVDVGYGQLDWKLRNDPRVINRERTNIRHISDRELPEMMDIIAIDVSFISTALVFPAITPWLKRNGQVVCLVKPQFEAGRDKVGKKGVIKDPEVHIEVINKVIGYARSAGLYCEGITYSPIKGPKGNIEYLLHFKPDPQGSSTGGLPAVDQTVHEAHQQLRKAQ